MGPFLQDSTPARCCQTAFESLSWFTAHCWNIHMVDHESVSLGWKSLQEAHSWEMLLSCLDLLRTTLQFQVAAKRCSAAGPDPCNALGFSALARVATHPKQLVWSNSEVGQGNPKLCFSYMIISQKKTMLQRTPPFLSKSRQRFSRLYPFYFWLHPLTTFLLLLCSTASNAAAALASILRQQALEVSVPTGEMRMHKNPCNHREVRMECIQILSTRPSRKN